MAQLGNNVLMGTKILLQFNNDTLSINSLSQNFDSDFANWKSMTDCNGNFLGTSNGLFLTNNTSTRPINWNVRPSELGSSTLCSPSNIFRTRYSFPSTLEPNVSHTILSRWNSNGDSIFYAYADWSFRNDSIIWATPDCSLVSDTLKKLPYTSTNFHHEVIKHGSKAWYIHPYRNSLVALEIDEISKKISKYNKTITQGNSETKGPNSTFRTSSGLRSSNTGDYIAKFEDDGTNAFNLYSFDKNTGAITYEKPLLTKTQLQSYGICTGFSSPSVLDGIAFSENDSLIYVAYTYSPVCYTTSQDYKKMIRIIYQIDRFATNSPGTARVVFSKYYNNHDDGRGGNYSKQTLMFTGPDGIIYYGMGFDNAISTIENANVYGGEIHTYNKYSVSGHLNIPGASLSPNTLKRASFDAFSNCADSTLAVFYGSDDLLRVAYYWGDGDSTVYDSGTIANGHQTSHRYDSSGVYTITQKSIFNNCGYGKTKTKTINVTLPPSHTGFELVADTACTSHTVTLTDTVEHTQSVQIDWGDGELDTLAIAMVSASPFSLSHTYTTQDTFVLSYKLIGYGIPSEGIAGCERQIDSNYAAAFYPAPLAEYTWTTNYTKYAALQDTILLCVDEGLTLTQSNDSVSYFMLSNSSGNDTSINDSLQLNLASDWYETILQGYTIHGCETKDTITIGISPRSTALWQGDTSTCQNVLALQSLKASILLGSIDSTTTDESLLLFQSADSLSVPFISATAGKYTISATVYSSTGCIDTFDREITVHTIPQIALAGDSIGCINTAIAYTPTIVSADSAIIAWYIDGTLTNTTAALPQNEHTAYEYSSTTAGIRQVAAVATTTYGCSATDTAYTTIQNPPTVQHSETALSICINTQPIELTATTAISDTSTVVHTWDASTTDSNLIGTSNTMTISHTYLAEGTYTLTSRVVDRLSGCADTTYTSITVHPQPEVNLASADACEDMQVEVVTTWDADTLLSYVRTYRNDVLLNEVNSPNNRGSSSLYYTAEQDENVLVSIARDTLGCQDTALLTTATLSLPVARYSTQYLSASGLEVTYLFTDKSTNHTSAELFYGDGISTVETPGFAQPYTYADSGIYNSSLVVSNQDICFDTTHTKILAFPFVDFHIPNSISPNGDGLNEYLNFSTLFIQELTIEIYTRWGEQVLRITSSNELIKTMDLSQGVYLAKYRIKDTFGTYHNIEQTITVIR